MFQSKTDEEEKRRRGIEDMEKGMYGQGKDIIAPHIHVTESPIAKASTCIGVREFFLCLPEEIIDNLKCMDIDEQDGRAHICAIPASKKPSLIHMDTKPINLEQPSLEPPEKKPKKPEWIEKEEYNTSDMPGWY
jgi:hypothetical protein